MVAQRPLRVFLSHTSELAHFPAAQSFVAAAEDVVKRAGHAVTDMQYFGPASETPARVCEQRVGDSDVYVAIVGFRYGSPVRDRPELSYTELEYEAALQVGVPRLVFLLSEEVHAPRSVTLDREYGDRQEAFRERLRDEATVATVATTADLQVALSQALHGVERRPLNAPSGRVKVFISYIAADQMWADWVTRVLMLAGYDVTPQGWRFVAGQDLAERASEVRGSSDCILVLISDAFAASPYGSEDWMTQLARTMRDSNRIIPLQVEDSELPASLADYTTLDISDRTPMLSAVLLVGELATRGFAAARLLRPEDDSAVTQNYPGVEPEISNLLPRNQLFTNRSDTLAKVCRALQASFGGSSLATCSLYGIAGVGKTEVAIEFAHKWKNRFDVIWWISAENSVSIAEALMSLARALDIVEIADQKEMIRRVWAALGRRGRWLLIFDNAEDRRDLTQFWPTCASGAVLLTSRSPTWGGLTGTAVAVDVFTPEFAHTFLRKRSKADESPGVGVVSEKLGYLPLALDQAGAYIEETQVSIETYDSLYLAGPARLLEWGRPDRYDRTVAATVAVSVQRAAEDHPHAKDLLGVISFFAPDDVPRDLLTDHAHALREELRPILADQIEFNLLLECLTQFSLVRADPKRIRMHRLFRDVLQEQEFTSDERTLYRADAVRLVAAAFPRNSDEVSTWEACGWLLPHVLACTDDVDELLPALGVEIGNVLQAAGRYLHTRGDYPDALVLFDRALEAREQPGGAAPVDRAETLISRGRVQYHLADLTSAQKSTEQALQIYLAERGVGSPEALGAVIHLGRIRRERGELADAERLARQALSILEGSGDMNSAIAASGLHVLGDALWRQGRLVEARATFEKALQVRQAMGESVPKVDLAASYKHVGIVCLELDQLVDAESELQRARDLFLDDYGHDHPDVVDVDGHLAELFRRTGRLDQALEWAERVLRMRRERLVEHPDVAGSLLKLGAVLRDRGGHEQAAEALRESAEMFAARMGEGHYYVAEAKMSLAQSLWDMGAADVARRELEEASGIFEAMCGPDHASTLRARHLLQELDLADDSGAVTARPSLVPLLEEQIRQVRRRVDSGLGGYSYEGDEIRTAVEQVDGLCDRLRLGELIRDLNPGTGKPQVLLEFRDARGTPVVLKVYGRRRPNEAAVQGLWAAAGVATARVLASADEPVSWLLMERLPGQPPPRTDGVDLTPDVARTMAPAHRVHRADVGEPKDLYRGIGVHLNGVLAAASAHGYAVPPGLDAVAEEAMGAGRRTFLHGDLATANLLRDGDSIRFLDTCGYTGPAEFDAARWCARVGGSARAEEALDRWLAVETALDRGLARRLLALELFMEAGVREIVKDEQGRPWADRDPETIALLATGSRLLDTP